MTSSGPKSWACQGKNGQICYQTHHSQLFLYQEHFLKVSSKSDEPNCKMLILDPIPPTAPPTFALFAHFALFLKNQIFPEHAVFAES